MKNLAVFMGEVIIFYRNKVIGGLYKGVLKPIFFGMDPEFVHDQMTRVGIILGRWGFGRKTTSAFFGYKNSILEQTVLGIDFKNPIGLSAGFDKDAYLADILPSVGFGFVEVGSVTAKPCDGNPKPRLWRLPKSKGLVVYYGLKNEGCEVVAKRLHNKKFDIPIGVSVAMTNCKENLNLESAIKDYAEAFSVMELLVDYVTVNISCPNAGGGQPFIDPGKLELLLATIDRIPTQKPIFLKLSPDLTEVELDRLLDIVRAHRIHGLVCTNLTKKRDNPKILDSNIPERGGLSGKVVGGMSDKMLEYIYRKEGKRFVLIGCGGVFTAEDAYRKIKLGASLIEMITGMIFEGPQVVSEINQGLAELLKKDGFTSISQAVGIDS
ncbi:MAG: quinone-dependent dihydroorotate dehydrogenase [Patescibacteria group bacterium]